MQKQTLRSAIHRLLLGGVAANVLACGGKQQDAAPLPTPATEAVKAQAAAQPKPLYALNYIAGPRWKPGKPPQEQDLAGHFGYVDKLFKQGKLVVNGLYGDEIRGLYMFAVDSPSDVNSIVAADPAVQNGTLVADGIAPWLVMWDGLDQTAVAGAAFFLLEYGPGRNWITGKSAMEQNLKEHFAYVTDKQKQGTLFAAGPLVGTDHGRYLITAASKTEADAYIAADPGVSSGVVAAISVRPWTPLNRQSQAASLARGAK
jgi:uncharacterized protein YciI